MRTANGGMLISLIVIFHLSPVVRSQPTTLVNLAGIATSFDSHQRNNNPSLSRSNSALLSSLLRHRSNRNNNRSHSIISNKGFPQQLSPNTLWSSMKVRGHSNHPRITLVAGAMSSRLWVCRPMEMHSVKQTVLEAPAFARPTAPKRRAAGSKHSFRSARRHMLSKRL